MSQIQRTHVARTFIPKPMQTCECVRSILLKLSYCVRTRCFGMHMHMCVCKTFDCRNPEISFEELECAQCVAVSYPWLNIRKRIKTRKYIFVIKWQRPATKPPFVAHTSASNSCALSDSSGEDSLWEFVSSLRVARLARFSGIVPVLCRQNSILIHLFCFASIVLWWKSASQRRS